MSKTSIEWTDKVWRHIEGTNGYIVSNKGSIRGPSGKILRPMRRPSGHLYVFVHGRKQYVHKLVLEAFVGPRPEGMECRHLDGNPANNNISNLRWGTHMENVEDRWVHGTMPKPFESKDTKLAPKDIPAIRDLGASGWSSRKIAKRFGTSHTTIQKIIRGERWKGF